MDKSYYIYILANKPRASHYIGVTNDLVARVWQHKEGRRPGFTSKHNVNRLVWFDETNDVSAAIQREKQLKKWRRLWKIELIEKTNPEWVDLSADWHEAKMDSRFRGNDNDGALREQGEEEGKC